MTDLREIANAALRHARTAPPHIRGRATQQWLAALAEAWLAEHPEEGSMRLDEEPAPDDGGTGDPLQDSPYGGAR